MNINPLVVACFLYEGQDDFARGTKDERVSFWGGAVERANLIADLVPALQPVIEDADGSQVVGRFEYDVIAQTGWQVADDIHTEGQPPTVERVVEVFTSLCRFYGYLPRLTVA